MSERLIPATKSQPCPVCGGDHKCSRNSDGLFLCGRKQGEQPGFRWLGECKNPLWHLYRNADDPRGKSDYEPKPEPPKPPRNFGSLAQDYADNFTPERLARLAAILGLTPEALAHIVGLGFDPSDGSFTFPEYDCFGQTLGISKRFPDGSKRMVPGSRRGLTLPAGWADASGPIFVVEGASDVLAMAACGLTAIGRPSALGGAELLVPLLSKLAKPRVIAVVGENDQKPDGSWPGKEGAKKVAASLAAGLDREVLVTLPPPCYKDAREWVTDQYSGAAEAFSWEHLGNHISRDLIQNASTMHPPERAKAPQCMSFNGMPLPRRFPMPVRIGELVAPGVGGISWVWDGFLARGAVTMLSALPKCGKTTLLGHLLAELSTGGEFCGRALAPGRALVISEEPAGVWAARRDDLHIPPDSTRLFTRGSFIKATGIEEWTGFLAHLTELLAGDPADLVVFDTIANLWPVKDENSAAEVTQAMSALHRLCEGRSVLLVHHLRKSDGGEGTGSRGSGAIAGFVDIILELRRQKTSLDPRQRRRVLTGYGRYDAIPTEWVVELQSEDDGHRFVHVPEPGEEQSCRAASELRLAILEVLTAADAPMTRKEIGEKLVPARKPNDRRLVEELEGALDQLWTKEGIGTKCDPVRYRILGEE